MASLIVNESNTALKLGSGAFNVLGTPAMIALMEKAAVEALRQHLEEGQDSVGVLVNVDHKAPTPLGMRVRAEAELTEITGRRLKFSVKAFDSREMIGEGFHERVLVDHDSFMWKAAAKAQM